MSRLASMAGPEHTVTGAPDPLQDCPPMTGRRTARGLLAEAPPPARRARPRDPQRRRHGRPSTRSSPTPGRGSRSASTGGGAPTTSAPNAVPVYVVGLQRSGTSMLMRGLDASPAVRRVQRGQHRGVREVPDPAAAGHPLADREQRPGLRGVQAAVRLPPGRRAPGHDGQPVPGPRRLGVPRRRRARALVGRAVRGEQPEGAHRDRRRRRSRALAGRRPLAGEPRPDRELRLGRDDRPSPPRRCSGTSATPLLFERGLDRRGTTSPCSRTTRSSASPERSMRGLCSFLGLEYDAAPDPAHRPEAAGRAAAADRRSTRASASSATSSTRGSTGRPRPAS